MPDAASNAIITQSIQESFQDKPVAGTGAYILHWLVRAGLNAYPWWSPARDINLRNFWKTCDQLGGAVYTIQSKMQSIPFLVKARDLSNKDHVKEAAKWTTKLEVGAEWGEGWPAFFGRWVEDLVTQDNGAFAEIIGSGNPAGPILGAPITIRHIDAGRCQRTGDPIYPIIYHDLNAKMYKIHASRVLYASQMTSPIHEMFGVGFSAISRAINTAQALVDVLTYKQEKLGSRPRRGILVAKGGLDPEDVAEAFKLVDSEQDSQALSRYSRIALVGDSSLPEAGLELTDLASLPDGFDEETSFNLGIAVLALAFGLDARELAPMMASGATRADALLQHLKQRGKGPGQIIQLTESLFNFKVLPPYLQLVFDFQDDEQDRQAAETKEIRSRRWNTAITSGSLDKRAAREQMMEVGDLERAQFERLELEDGRLPDGASVLALFYSKNTDVKKLLNLGLGADFDPFAVDINAPETILPAIRERMAKAQTVIVNGTTQEERWTGMQAVAALKELEKQYRTPSPEEQMQAGQPGQPGQPKPGTPGQPPTQTEHDNRVRKVSLQSPNRTGIKPDEKLERNSDEKEAGIQAESPF